LKKISRSANRFLLCEEDEVDQKEERTVINVTQGYEIKIVYII